MNRHASENMPFGNLLDSLRFGSVTYLYPQVPNLCLKALPLSGFVQRFCWRPGGTDLEIKCLSLESFANEESEEENRMTSSRVNCV